MRTSSCHDLGVRTGAQRVEIDAACRDGAAIGDLLAREAAGAQVRVGAGHQRLGVGRADRLDPAPDRAGGGDGDLLADDGGEKLREAVRAAAQRRRAGAAERHGEARFAGREPGGALGHVGVGLDDASGHGRPPGTSDHVRPPGAGVAEAERAWKGRGPGLEKGHDDDGRPAGGFRRRPARGGTCAC